MLLAYGREVATPRPYRLADLAKAAGMSISAIRTAYDRTDIERATQTFAPLDSKAFEDMRHAISAMRSEEQRPGDPG